MSEEKKKFDLAEYKRKWAAENKDKVRASQAEYRKRNREKIRASNKDWRKRNTEKRNAQARREYERRKDHYVAVVRESGDLKNPGRPIRRFAREFRRGSITRDELIERVVSQVSRNDEKGS